MENAEDVPSLLQSSALMAYLQSELQHLEALVGGQDQEARMLLQQLEQQTQLMQTAAQGQQSQQSGSITELELAQQLDSLDLQLSNLETALADADGPTRELLGQSTSRWLQSAPGNQTTAPSDASQQQSLPDASRDAGRNSSSSSGPDTSSSPAPQPADMLASPSRNNSSNSGSAGVAHCTSQNAVLDVQHSPSAGAADMSGSAASTAQPSSHTSE